MDKSELLHQLKIDRGAETPRSGARRGVIAAIAIVIALAGASYWWLSGAAAAEVETAPARALPQSAGNASVLDASGYVTARRQATVSAKVTGKVATVLIEEGMRVEEGQVLATLEDTEARAQYELSQAQLESARAQVGEARALATQARREYERQQELAARKLASGSALDAARAQADSIAARLRSSERGVAVAQEYVKVAQVQLDNTVVRAPFAGVVTVKAAQPGEMISPISAGGGFTRTGIGTIVDMDSLEVEVDVNESYIDRVRAGQPVEAVLNAYPDWKIPATVIAIIPTADRAKATVKVRVALQQRDSRIVPDMGARVAFLEDAKPVAAPAAPVSGVLVPSAAVRKEGRDTVVYVERDGRIARRLVTAGRTHGDSLEVTTGVAAGERVVVAGHDGLEDGDAVRTKSGT
ncbi:MAG TPA: efflux RND transporter periplasmic adaptor subunit [Candidatus Saccharimonadia bacterium]|nr:efflux RND transporter periplasmic adaptor subunit [Candidatus Saccharimonadia bacterium]